MNEPVPPAPPELRMDGLPTVGGAAEERPFVLAGDQAAVLGRETSGIDEVLLHPIRAVAGLQLGLPAADRVRISTGALQRRMTAPVGAVTESVLAFRTLPGVVVRWSRPDAEESGRPLHLSLAWECPDADAAGDAPPEPDDDGTLRVPLTGGRGAVVFQLRGATGQWQVQQRSVEGERRSVEGERRLRIGVRAFLAARSPVALVTTLTRDGDREADAVRSRLDHLDAELRGWAADEREATERGPTLEGGEGELADALEWARRRLRATLVHPGGHRPGRVVSGYGRGCGAPAPPERDDGGVPPAAVPVEAAWIGHGLLADGRHDAARELTVDVLDGLGAPEEAAGPGSSPDETALLLCLAGRYALWSGDPGPLVRRERALVDALDGLRGRLSGDAPVRTLAATAAAHRDVADALEAGDRPETAATLRPAWEALRRRLEEDGEAESEHARDPGSSARIQLPVLGTGGGRSHPRTRPASAPRDGGGGAPPVALQGIDPGVLAAVLRVPGPAPAPPGSGGGRVPALETALWAWAAWERGDPDAAMEAWRSVLHPADGGGRALWGRGILPEDPTSGCAAHSATTALAVAPLVFGLLGARADATYGRLRLAPRVPPGWSRFQVRGLRVGDGRIRIAYRREGQRHTFVLEPIRGRYPLNVAFEPLLPTAAIERVRVGGEEADVDAYRHRDRAGVRLQLPLDSRREITVEGADERG